MFKALTKHYCKSNIYAHTGQEIIDTFFLTCSASSPTRSLFLHKEEDENPYTVATLLAYQYQFPGCDDRRFTREFFDKGPSFLKATCANRKLVITESGYFGAGSIGMQKNDVIVVPFGGELVFILRKKSNGDGYLFVGNSYIHGLMNGEAIHAWRNDKLKDEYFALS
jgi:hypothetical protein